MSAHPRPVLRDRNAPDHGRVNFVELFFDLVFVFAVTQLSHRLLEHMTLEGVIETGFLTLAVWAVWMWTTWAANWLNARAPSVRLMLFALMGGGLVLSASIPDAFGERGLSFALAYAAMQNGRNAFTVWALRKGEPSHFRNFQRIQVWLAIPGALWIAGGFLEGEARWALWVAALAIELGAPWWAFWVPGMGRSSTADWSVDPGHMAERCGLFVILALGESIIILGATFAGLAWTATYAAAFLSGLVGAVAMWWVYFATTAEAADEAFARHADPGRIARAGYTYSHIPLVAGVILAAVADELVLAHPTGHVEIGTLAATLGGPALFLVGVALFNRMICGAFPLSNFAGVALLAAIAPFGMRLSPLATAAAATGVLVLVAAWETIAPTNRGRSGART